MGFTLTVDNGPWDFWKPGAGPNPWHWHATYTPTFEAQATKAGDGINMAHAMQNARPIQPPADAALPPELDDLEDF